VKQKQRIPPHNIDAETSVLGSCLIDPDVCSVIMDKLSPEDFYQQSHATIFRAMVELYSEQKPIDMVTITQKLINNGELKNIGGASYVAHLSSITPTSSHAEYYADIVSGLADRRRVISAAMRIAQKGYDAKDADKYRAWAESEIYQATSVNETGQGPRNIRDILVNDGVLQEIIDVDPNKLEGVQTPWVDVNQIICTFAPTDFIIVAARPSMGKTAFALQVAIHAAKKHGPVVIYSLEMSKKQLLTRAISVEGNIPGHLMRSGYLSDKEHQKTIKTAQNIAKLPLYIDDRASLTVAQIKSRSRRIQAKHGLALVVIDYLQLITGSGESRVQEISSISRGLKAMAKELNVPVLSVAQLSRAVEQRANKRPIMSDLRESGQLEQDADTVIFLYRDDYYNRNSKKKGIAEVNVAKSRNGPIGMAELVWMNEFTRFNGLYKGDTDNRKLDNFAKEVPIDDEALKLF